MAQPEHHKAVSSVRATLERGTSFSKNMVQRPTLRSIHFAGLLATVGSKAIRVLRPVRSSGVDDPFIVYQFMV